MSRSSNNNKPFYVDVGTSIVAIRCASDHYIITENDYGRFPIMLNITKDLCDRLNKEAEISRQLRNCDVGTAEEQSMRFHSYCLDNNASNIGCTNCPLHKEKGRCEFIWAQLPYEKEGEE